MIFTLQVDAPFGTNIGGTVEAFWPIMPTCQSESWPPIPDPEPLFRAPFGYRLALKIPANPPLEPDSPGSENETYGARRFDSWLTAGETAGNTAGAVSSIGIDWPS